MNERDQRSTRRGGCYWREGQPFLSVTKILEVIDRPALRYWYGDQIYSAMIADPTLDRKAAHRKPYEVSDAAKNRGSTVHSIIESIKAGAPLTETTPEFQGYLNAFNQWSADYGVEIVEQERTVWSSEGYAGTLDLLTRVGGHELATVTDIKTGKAIYPEAFLQTAAYQNAIHEQGIQTNGTGVLLLRPDGGYSFEFRPDTSRALAGFRAAKTLYEALNEEELTKIGYFQEGVK